MIDQYVDNINDLYNREYNVELTNNSDYIIDNIPDRLTIVYAVFDNDIVNKLEIINKTRNTPIEISFLNTEPLNLLYRLEQILDICKLYPDYKIYDYSKSNIEILAKHNINNTEHLPYICNKDELEYLKDIHKNTDKIYDFGIICDSTATKEQLLITPRRRLIVEFLIKNNYTINKIIGWNNDRDQELAKCKIILNLHGQLPDGTKSEIFEHIRCNRLLESGFTILSEKSYKLDPEFINQYSANLKIIEYDDFFNLDIINNTCIVSNIKNTNITSKELLSILHNYNASAWLGHMEFAAWLVKKINPKIIVDLGVDYGHSTFALAAHKIGHIYGIDSFEGDCQAGFKDTERQVNDFKKMMIEKKLLIDNITFIKGYFINIYKTFDKEIDILHIDGLHNYENVKEDYDTWNTKTNNNSIILFHDVISYPDTVGKFFNEIPYPKFYFTHSAGLGVVCKNYNLLKELYDSSTIPYKENIVFEKSKNYCFIHSCHLKEKGTKRLDYLIDKINLSGLINILDKIFINNIGIALPIDNKYGDKFRINNYSDNPKLYEMPTINKVREFAISNNTINNTNANILYLHTKGISYSDNYQEENDWIDMMLYFLVEEHKVCIDKLDTTDINAVGCNFMHVPTKHFSGNFWWAKSNYIKTLPILDEYKVPVIPTDAEVWLCQNNPIIYELHNSHVNHYYSLYPKEKYMIISKKEEKEKIKIIDCFTFYNELDLLKYRLSILDDYVDYFVLVEATHTHVGKEKPLFYQENKEQFKEFNHKIIHVIVDDFSHMYPDINTANNEQWINERFQRNCISRGLEKLTLNQEDIITITDLDEIPDPKIFAKIKNSELKIDVAIIELDFYYYNLNCKMDHNWRLSKIIAYKKYTELKEQNISCEDIRQNCSYETIKKAGWHLSYFGNSQFIKNKIENFGHQELNLERFTNQDKIANRIENKLDLYDRPIAIINIAIKDNDYLPPQYYIYLRNFYNSNDNSNLIDSDKFNMKVFIIHYKKLVERKTNILAQLSKYNIRNYEFVEIDRDELINHDTSIFQENFGNGLSAISLSHFYAYSEIAKKYDNALILEDDAIFDDNFTNKFNKYMEQLPEDYDILYLGDGCALHIDKKNIIPNKNIYVRENGDSRCADSYIINKKCAKFLCTYIYNLKDKINTSIDAWLGHVACDNNLKIYWAEPTIVTQGSQSGLFDRSWINNSNNSKTNLLSYLNLMSNSDFSNIFNAHTNLKFYYGVDNNQIDITDTVFQKCKNNNEIIIEDNDYNRANLFGDPLFGVIKKIYIINGMNYCIVKYNEFIYIDLLINIFSISGSFEPDVLTLYKSPFTKFRLGKDFDGGYIITDIPNINYGLLLSCGISDDISFEEEFCNKYPETLCYAYDGTIENINIVNKNISFYKKNINNFNDNNNTDLHDVINNSNNIFLKMDIEGYEIPWIKTLSDEQFNQFSQIVIEFHFPFSVREIETFNKLNKTHILVHFHANNCCGVRNHKGVNIPNVFECTYIHRKYYEEPYKLNTEIIPGLLDMKNVLANDEIIIDYEPFVYIDGDKTLKSLAEKYGTDKLEHNYIQEYETVFHNIKDHKLDILEIGVREGWSHLMWAEYFINSNIYGIDNFSDPVFIDNKINKKYNFDNIKVFIGDQIDEHFLNKSINFKPDIIIDDGGHKMSHQQLSLKYLFKKLQPHGYYIIEDLHTSEWGGFLDVPDKSFSTLNFLKNIKDQKQRPDQKINSYFIHGDELKYILNNIKTINIYNDKLCIIQKSNYNDYNNYNVYVNGISGLGNSLFQIATAIAYKEKYDMNILLENNSYALLFGTSKQFNRQKNKIDPNTKSDITYNKTIFKNFTYYDPNTNTDLNLDLNLNSCVELKNDYTDNSIIPTSNILIKGYCQNTSLFKDYLHKIPHYLNLQDQSTIDYIKSKYLNIENGIMIGIRVGEDFKHMNKITRDSYINALERLRSMEIKIDNLFIISDLDNAWTNIFGLQELYPATEVLEDDITQMHLGIMCRHFILSESTFHLWIAYLASVKDDKKVIVFNNTDITNRNLALDNWIKIDYTKIEA